MKCQEAVHSCRMRAASTCIVFGTMGILHCIVVLHLAVSRLTLSCLQRPFVTYTCRGHLPPIHVSVLLAQVRIHSMCNTLTGPFVTMQLPTTPAASAAPTAWTGQPTVTAGGRSCGSLAAAARSCAATGGRSSHGRRMCCPQRASCTMGRT